MDWNKYVTDYYTSEEEKKKQKPSQVAREENKAREDYSRSGSVAVNNWSDYVEGSVSGKGSEEFNRVKGALSQMPIEETTQIPKKKEQKKSGGVLDTVKGFLGKAYEKYSSIKIDAFGKKDAEKPSAKKEAQLKDIPFTPVTKVSSKDSAKVELKSIENRIATLEDLKKKMVKPKANKQYILMSPQERVEYDKQEDAVYQMMADYLGEDVKKMKKLYTPEKFAQTYLNPDLRDLKSSKTSLELYIENVEQGSQSSIKGMVQNIKDKGIMYASDQVRKETLGELKSTLTFENIPVVGSLKSILNTVEANQLGKKIDNGEPLTAREETVKARIEAEQMFLTRELSSMQKNVRNVVPTLSAIVEIALVPAAKGTETMGFIARNKAALKRAAKITSTTKLPEVIDEFAKRVSDEYTALPTKDGGFELVKSAKGQQPVTSAILAFSNVYAQTATELMLGDNLDMAAKSLLKPLTSRLGSTAFATALKQSKAINVLSKLMSSKFLKTFGGVDSLFGEISEEFVQNQTEKLLSGQNLGMSKQEVIDTVTGTAFMWLGMRPLELIGQNAKGSITQEDIEKLPEVVQEKLMQKVKEKGTGELDTDDAKEVFQGLAREVETGVVQPEQLTILSMSPEQRAEFAQRNRRVNEDNTTKLRETVMSGEKESERLSTPETISKYANFNPVITSVADPEAEVTVYRGANGGDISVGDFVTLDKARAQQYVDQRQDAQLLEMKVKLGDLVASGGLQTEFIYAPVEVVTKQSGKPADDTILANKGSLKIGEFEKRPEVSGTDSSFKIYRSVVDMANKYNTLLSERYNIRGTLGTHRPGRDFINVRGVNSVGVFVHELIHKLDHDGSITNGIADKDIKTMLRDLYQAEYPAPKKGEKVSTQLKEGLSMLVQRYIESPSMVKQQYPELYNAFIDPKGEYFDPIIGEAIGDANNIVAVYQGLKAHEKIQARIYDGKELEAPKQNVFTFWDRARYQVQDDKAFIRRLDLISKEFAVRPSLYSQLNHRTAFLNRIGRNFTPKEGFSTFADDTSGDFIVKYDFNWGDISDEIAKMGEKEAKNFESFLIARDQHFQYERLDELTMMKSMLEAEREALRYEYENANTESEKLEILEERKKLEKAYKELFEEWKNVYTTLQSNSSTREEIEDAYKIFENNAKFKGLTKKIDTLTKENLQMLAHPLVQVLSVEKANELLTKHQGYARMTRVFLDETLGLGEASDTYFKAASNGKVSSLKARSGGEYILENPINAYLYGAHEIMKKALNQATLNSIGNYDNEGIPSTLIRTVPYTRELEGKNDIVIYYNKYKKQAMYVDPWLKEQIDDAMFPKQAHWMMNFLRVGTRVFQAGTTGLYPQFAITNFFMMDSPTAFVLSDKQDVTIPVFTAVSTAIKAFKDRKVNNAEAKYFKEYAAFGATQYTSFGNVSGTAYDQAMKRLETDTQFFNKLGESVSKTGKFSLDTLEFLGKKSEAANRAVVYVRARMRGVSQLDALTKAGEVTGSFYKSGAFRFKIKNTEIRGKELLRLVPYGNASIQTTLNFVEAISKNPSKRARFVALLSIYAAVRFAGVMAIASGGSDEQKRRMKDLDPELLSSYIYLPAKDKKKLMKFRLGEMFGAPTALFNMVLNNEMLNGGKNDYGFNDYYRAATSFIPDQFNVFETKKFLLSWTPHTVSTNLAIYFNKKTWPEVSDLEPEYMADIRPGDRAFTTTSAVAKLLGKYTNISPIKIDAFIEGNVGRTSRYFMFKPGIWNPVESLFFDKYTIHDSRDLKNISKRSVELTSKMNAYKDGSKEFSADEYMKFEREKKANNQIKNMVQTYIGYVKGKDEEKAQKLLPEILEKMDMYKAGEYDFSKKTEKQLTAEMKKMAKVEALAGNGYPEIVGITLESSNDKRIYAIEKMFKEDPDRARDFYNKAVAMKLFSDELRQRIREEVFSK